MRHDALRDLPLLGRWTWILAQICGVVAVALAIVFAQTARRSPADRAALLGLLLVVVWDVGLLWRPRSATLFGCLAAVPAIVVGSLWQTQVAFPASFGWFSYSPLSTTIVVGGLHSRPTDLTMGALTVLLWAVATLGLVAAVRSVRPVGGPVRTLAVVAAVLTGTLWVPITDRSTPWGVGLHLLGAPPRVAVVRTAALALVLAVGVVVVLARRRVPARTAAYAVPAAAMTWVLWHTDRRIFLLADSSDVLPGRLDTAAFVLPQLASYALVAILWILTAFGLRELVMRYRPPEAVLTP